MTGPHDDLTVEQAGEVLAVALSAPGSGEAVLRSLGGVPPARFTPARASGLFRRGEPASLAVGEWVFAVPEPGGTRLRVSHVVRGVTLRSDLVGPAQAGPLLATALLDAAREDGPQSVAAAQAILYGIAVVNG